MSSSSRMSLTVMNPVDRSSRNDSVSSWFNQAPRNFGLGSGVDDGLLGRAFLACSYLAVAATFPLSLLLCFKVVQEYERAVIFRLGKLIGGGAKGPGLFFILPCIDDYSVVDLRTITFDVPPQEVLTKDSVTVSVDAVVYYRIWLPTIAVSNVADYGNATRLLTSTTLRNVLGTKTLTEILGERENISVAVRAILDEVTKVWGVKVERVELKDVRLPVNFQRSMAVEAEAVREARAKIINSEGEKKASYALTAASEILSLERMALQLRYIQNLSSHAEGKETTILFPVPLPMSFGLNSTLQKDYHNYKPKKSISSESSLSNSINSSDVEAEGDDADAVAVGDGFADDYDEY